MEENLPGNDSRERPLGISYLTDFELHTEDGHSFQVHRANLSLKSNYFLSMFCDFELEGSQILIKGVSGEILSNILSYIYTGQISINENNIRDILIASDYLLLDDLLSLIKSDLEKHLTLSSCIGVFTAAKSINQVDIAKESFRFVETNFGRIMSKNRKTVLELSKEELKMMLNDSNLCVSSEKIIWLAIVEWIEANLPSRLPLVPEFLRSLAIEEVDHSLACEILNHNIVANNKFCERISDIKSSQSKCHHKMIQCFIRNNSENGFHLRHRSPSKLRFISLKRKHRCHEVYVTYDDRIDLWRKILRVKASTIFIMNASVYIYECKSNSVSRYSVLKKKWYQCSSFSHEHSFPYVARLVTSVVRPLGRMIRDFFSEDEDEIFTVKFYDPEADAWYDTAPMLPIDYGFAAAVLGESIYVVGRKPEFDDHGMMAQVYDSRAQVWSLLPAPSTSRYRHRAIVYRDKIFVIGGRNENHFPRNDAEVFDPAQNVWFTISLPFAYASFETYVFDDRLIVSGDHNGDCFKGHLYSTVMWDGDRWEVIAEPSTDSNMSYYRFHTLEDAKLVKKVSKQNNDPGTVFEKSPFPETLFNF